jgi:lysophospholipase L1-like esterase
MVRIFLLMILFFGWASGMKAEITIHQQRKSISANLSAKYQWYFNGKVLPGQTSRELFISQKGKYTVETTDYSGQKHTEEIMVDVNAGTIRRIFIIGDSTASDYPASVYPQTGWGEVFQQFFNKDSILIMDKAVPGSSSKSFYNNTWGWSSVLPLLSKGDFLFIQFAHNDEKSTIADLYTEPFTTYKEFLTRYINESKTKGAIPVLLTPVNRNFWNRDTITISNSHGDYPTAMKELALATKTPILDISAKSKTLIEKYGKYASTWNIFLFTRPGEYPNYPSGIEDNTHFSEKGATEIAKLVADALWENVSDTIQKLLVPHLLINTNMNTVKYDINPAKSGYILGPTKVPKNLKYPVKASPANNYLFANWTVNGSIFSSAPEVVINGNTTYNLKANFSKKGTNTSFKTISDTTRVNLVLSSNKQLKVLSAESICEISIYTLKGVCLMSLKPMNTEVCLSTENLLHGIYLVKIRTQGGSIAKKISL